MQHGGAVHFRAAVVAALAVAVVAGGASVATAAPLPSDGEVVLDGHGWGHARGMGQWGARGMAERGVGWAKILSRYYSGADLSRRGKEYIRALVESGRDVIVTADGPVTAHWSGGGKITQSTSSKPFLRAVPTSRGYRVQRARPDGDWSTVATGRKPVVFRPTTSAVGLVFDDGSVRYYRGNIEARRTSRTAIHAVNGLNLEHYLYGVVPREMPSSWDLDAVRAQSVAARTFAVYQKVGRRARGLWYDICATTACQVYGGYGRKGSLKSDLYVLETSRSRRAVRETAGRVLTYLGDPILAQYSSSTGGYTKPGSLPYQKALPDPDDAGSPHHLWRKDIGVRAIQRAFPAIGRLTKVRVTARNGYGDWGGRARRVTVYGTEGRAGVSGDRFRSMFGLKSDWFRVRGAGDPGAEEPQKDPPPADSGAAGMIAGEGLGTGFPDKPYRSFLVQWYDPGAQSYDVQVRRASHRTDFGGVKWWRRGSPRRSGRITGTPGYTYCFRARGIDAAGKPAAWSDESCGAVAVDDHAFKATRGGWQRRNDDGSYLGTYTRGRSRGGSLVRWNVRARRLWLVATRCPGCGVVDVLFGGSRVARIDLNGSSWERSKVLPVASYSSARRARTLEIRIVKPRSKGVLIEGFGIAVR